MPAAGRIDRGSGFGTWAQRVMLHRVKQQAERNGRPIAIRPTVPGMAIESGESFVPVAPPSNPAEGAIRIEVRVPRRNCERSGRRRRA